MKPGFKCGGADFVVTVIWGLPQSHQRRLPGWLRSRSESARRRRRVLAKLQALLLILGTAEGLTTTPQRQFHSDRLVVQRCDESPRWQILDRPRSTPSADDAQFLLLSWALLYCTSRSGVVTGSF